MRTSRIPLPAGLLLLATLILLPIQASGAAISGNNYNVFFYSDTDLGDIVSTDFTFETNGTLLIDAFDGFGIYLPAGPAFSGIFSAPQYDATDKTIGSYSHDLFLVISGVAAADFIGGACIALVDYQFSEVFFFFGYSD
ncbi:MAG: hypothetical protein GY868_15280 [Deltaproteobacteria bacterium]|nr:hypothetical protein [Deltaproteobacteria bacterium]